MKLFIIVIFSLFFSCGEKHNDHDNSNIKNDDIVYNWSSYDLSNITEDRLVELEKITKDFYNNPNDIRLLNQIEKIVKSFGIKKKVIDLIDSKEMENGRSALTFLISKYWFKLDDIQKSSNYYEKAIFNWGVKIGEARNSIIEYVVLKELLDYSLGKRKSYYKNFNFIKSGIIYDYEIKSINILDYLNLNYPEVSLNETESSIFIDFYNLNKNFVIENSILVSDKNIIISGRNIFFDLLSGIQTKNGKNIQLKVNYLQNGIFFTTDTNEFSKAKQGEHGRNATGKCGSGSIPATIGKNGENGKNGINGGDIIIDSIQMPNSLCSVEICRTIFIMNGSKGQNGGDGGRGGNGISYSCTLIDYDARLEIMANFHHYTETFKSEPQKGGSYGIGGRGGLPGKMVVKGSGFAINTLIEYSSSGTNGANGSPGINGIMR